MQQHSGQHILSQSFVQVLEAETLSFHLGETVSTIEVDLRGISEQDIEKIERLANQIIYENREIKTYFVTLQQAEKLKLRKPPQKQEEIRIVEISDFDISACGGTHCQNTGEIGIIKIKKWEKIRNNLRFEFLCGQRALKDYFQKNILVNRLSTRFSVKDEELSQAIDRLYDDFKTQRKKVNKLQEKLIEYEAKEIAQKAEGKIIKIIFSDREVKEVKYLALNIIKQGDFVALLGLKSERVYLFLARSETLSFDMREIVDLVAPIIEGRGGGSASFVEIGGEKKENLTQALEKAYQLILNRKL
ncbi:MAG: DHHA1 domain-containing protein, partial [Candidatus Aminicenantia bacterium]